MTILRGLLGLAFFCFVAWLLSSDRKRVNVRVLVGGILLQILLGVVILETDVGRRALDSFAQVVTKIVLFGEEGAKMVFGPLTGFTHEPVSDAGAGEPPEAITWYASYPFHLTEPERKDVDIVALGFKALPTIIYFSALMSILYYLGIMQRLIQALAKVMTWAMRVSGAESLAMAANVFVGQTEAPLVVKPYIKVMTRSELMALMTGGFATIAGSVLAVYIGILGVDYAGDLLAASFMSAPAAFVMAKIMVPETEQSVTAGNVQVSDIGDEEDRPANLLDAAAVGTGDGLKLYLNVLAMLIAFVALVALFDAGLGLLPVGGEPLSLARLFGWVFAPVAWAMGVEWADCQGFGTLLGTKVAVNEFIAMGAMADMKIEQTLSPRSLHMAAFALCGFANFSSIGIQIGGISPLAPERRGELSRLALRAMLGGAFASWMTACIAGMFL